MISFKETELPGIGRKFQLKARRGDQLVTGEVSSRKNFSKRTY